VWGGGGRCSGQVRTALQSHSHVPAPAAVGVKADSSTPHPAGELRVMVFSQQLEASQLKGGVRHRSAEQVSMKHNTEDEDKSPFEIDLLSKISQSKNAKYKEMQINGICV